MRKLLTEKDFKRLKVTDEKIKRQLQGHEKLHWQVFGKPTAEDRKAWVKYYTERNYLPR